MELLPNVQIIDCGLYFRKHKLLVVTDTQFGYEEYLNKQGVLVPRFVHKDMLEKIEKILKRCCSLSHTKKIDTVLINGDIKHEFGTISETEWRHCIRFLKLLQQYTHKIILVKGNHDILLEPIAQTRGLKVVDHYILDDILFVHGDYIPPIVHDTCIKTIVMGHEHPAVSLHQWPRIEKYKAFLVGTWKRKKLIVLPSFNTATEGTDILKEHLLSPFLQESDLKNFDAYLVADTVYYFGKISPISSLCSERTYD